MPVQKTLRCVMFLATLVLAAPASAKETEPALVAETASLLDRTKTTISDLLLKGLELVGVNYRRGGNDPDAGLDCSGLVRIVFQDALGVGLPRTAKEMSAIGEKIERAQLQPGDLVFFNTMRRAFSHVGIYLGDDKFLHAPRPGAEVRVDDLRGNYWTHRFDGARRIVDPI
jgi:cell wall-associated NlpC family hydrolase